MHTAAYKLQYVIHNFYSLHTLHIQLNTNSHFINTNPTSNTS